MPLVLSPYIKPVNHPSRITTTSVPCNLLSCGSSALPVLAPSVLVVLLFDFAFSGTPVLPDATAPSVRGPPDV